MKIFIPLITLILLAGCSDDFLEKKPNKSIVVPSTLDDLEALLNNTGIMNAAPALGVLGADDYFMSDQGWAELANPIEKNGYIWKADVYEGQQSCSDWNTPYQQVFYSNVVLDALNSINVTAANESEWKAVRGRALFHRGFAFYQLAQLFCSPYREEVRDAPGIPLRLTSDVGVPVTRSTLGETYDRILQDLSDARALVPDRITYRTQPSTATADAALAMVYMSMGDYARAEEAATSSLAAYSTLIDYNTLNAASTRPISRFNDEVLFHASVISYRFITSTLTYVDTVLYADYHDDDLRKLVFFRRRADNRYNFKGNYTGASSLFGGISTGEVYLMRAECRARNGNADGAREDLNALLEKRWRTGTFVPVTETDAEALLSIILAERRKELVFRPVRWTDLRRLNQEDRFRKELSRKLNGQVYTLPPNDPRYVYPVPPQEKERSGI